jgi:Response regulator containing CheY-like receiver domain and AraC-type DNA-binding domain
MPLSYPLRSENGGLFVSQGIGRHPDRTISSYEVIFVSRGTLRLAEVGRSYSVEAGCYLILVPGVRHWGSEDFPPGLRFYWLHFTLRRGSKSAKAAHLRFPRQGRVAQPERLAVLFRWFLDAQEKQELDQVTADMLCLMILHVIEGGSSLLAAKDAVATVAQEARRIVASSFRMDISTSVIAAQLRCNPDYLGRVYKRAFGLSIVEDIHAKRIGLAKKLLMDGYLSIKEIAARCGFSDAVYFRRVFKKREGLGPLAFRKIYSHMHINTT